jgi:hypothetical protein
MLQAWLSIGYIVLLAILVLAFILWPASLTRQDKLVTADR